MKLTCIGLTALLLFIISVGLQSASSPPLLDDEDEISHIRNLESGWKILGVDCYGLFRPVKNLIFYAICRIRTDRTVLWRCVALLIYLPATGLVMLLSNLIFRNRMRAMMVAAVWASAPTQVSSLAWLSCINILLMSAAFFSALLAYDVSQTRLETGRTGAGLGLLSLSVLSYCVALFCYESSIVFPAIVVLWDWLRRRLSMKSKRILLPYALFWGMTLVYISGRLVARSTLVMINDFFSPMSPGQTIFASAYFVTDHLLIWLSPFGRQNILGTFVWEKTASFSQLISCWILLILFLLLIFRIRRTMPLVSFGLAWFFIAFVPTSNLIPIRNGPFADYYLVTPSMGLAVAVIGLLGYLYSAVIRNRSASGCARLAAVVLFALITCWRAAAATVSFKWARAWNTHAELFRRSVAAGSRPFAARANLARLLKTEGHLEEAQELALQSRTEAPWYTLSYNVLGDLCLEYGRYEEACSNFIQSVQLNPGAPYPYFALGYIQETYLSNNIRAEQNYRKVLGLPWTAYSHRASLNLSRLLALEGNLDEAIGIIEAAVSRNPSSPDLRHNAALAYKQKGNVIKAREHFEIYRALKAGNESENR